MRKFEKITLKQFIKDTKLTAKEYNQITPPHRATKKSAGYDFHILKTTIIKPREIKKLPTGIKAQMNSDELLTIHIRSSLGFKYNLRLCNQTGIIDSDYYNNEDNEGHIFIAIQNEGNQEITLNSGDRFAQGIFIKYLIVDDETKIEKLRQGGMGSTNKKNKEE